MGINVSLIGLYLLLSWTQNSGKNDIMTMIHKPFLFWNVYKCVFFFFSIMTVIFLIHTQKSNIWFWKRSSTSLTKPCSSFLKHLNFFFMKTRYLFSTKHTGTKNIQQGIILLIYLLWYKSLNVTSSSICSLINNWRGFFSQRLPLRSCPQVSSIKLYILIQSVLFILS